MWAWWLIFLLFAAALGYFATWYFVNNRIPDPEVSTDDLPAESLKLFALKVPRSGSGRVNNNLESRLQSIESKVNQYTNGQHDLMVKLAKLEVMQTVPGRTHEDDVATRGEDEGWEEMYYEAREARELLEEDAEKTSALLEEKDRMIAELMEKNSTGVDHGTMMTSPELKAAIEKINDLEIKLNNSLRENKAIKELATKENLPDINNVLKQENTRLKSELEDMHKYADSLLRKSFQIEAKLDKLAKNKSEQNFRDDERGELRETVEEIFSENEKLALKIKDLQDKLKDKDFSHNPGSLK